MITLQTFSQISQQRNPSNPVLGPTSLTFINCVHKVHRVFVVKQRAEAVVKNEKNTVKYLTGFYANFILKGTSLDQPLRVAAKMALFGSTFFKVIQRYEDLTLTRNEFFKALRGAHVITSDIDPFPKLSPLSPTRALRLMSESTEAWVRIRFHIMSQRVALFGYYFFHMFIDTLKLSSALIELSEVYTLSEIEEEDAKSRILISVQDTFDGLVDNQEKVLETLSANEQYIDFFLKRIKAPYKTQDIMDRVELVSGGAKKVSEKMNKASTILTSFAGSAWKFLKRAVYSDEETVKIANAMNTVEINFENIASHLPFKKRDFHPIPKSIHDVEQIVPSA